MTCAAKQKEYKKKYRSTLKGRLQNLYNGIKDRCGNKNGKNPSYTNAECRITWEDFRDWGLIALAAKIADNPDEWWTVDRIAGPHYEAGNLQFIAMSDNAAKQRRYLEHPDRESPGGMAWCIDCQDYKSIDDFSRQTGTAKRNGLQSRCKPCAAKWARNYRTRQNR